MSEDLLIISFRTIIGYIILHLAMKLMGKREIGQLSLFDAIILMTTANITVLGIENYEDSFWYSIIPVILISIIQKLIAFIILKVSALREVIDGKKTFIIVNGKIMYDNMQKERYNVDDLIGQLREKGIRSVDEIEYAVLETSGKLSIYHKSRNNFFPFPVIISGKIAEDNIKVGRIEKEVIIKKIEEKNLKLKDNVIAYFYNNELLIPELVDFKNNKRKR